MSTVRRRPDFTHAVRALIEHVAKTAPEFAHVDAARIVVVAGEARRASRGTVRPLAFTGGRRKDSLGRKKPLVKLHGVRCLYTITLRPLFFRRSTPRQRVATILHELFHISHGFDGTLDHHRRHEDAGDGFEAAFARSSAAAGRRCRRSCVAPFAYDGEVRMKQWLEKPPELAARRARLAPRPLHREAPLRRRRPPEDGPEGPRREEEGRGARALKGAALAV